MLKRKGFTLIELLVVVLIIGILAAIALPQYQLAVLKTRYTQLMVMADAIRQAQDAYYLAAGKYSLKINDLDITVPADCRVSESGGGVNCSKFYCTVNDGASFSETSGYVYCATAQTSSKRMFYRISPLRNNPKRQCAVSPTNDLGKKVCESLGGVLHSVGETSGLLYYRL